MVRSSSPAECPVCSTRLTAGGECPACQAEASTEYAANLKWFRVAFVGAILTFSGLMLTFLGSHYALVGWYAWLIRLSFLGGLLAIAVGLIGFIFLGGKPTA